MAHERGGDRPLLVIVFAMSCTLAPILGIDDGASVGKWTGLFVWVPALLCVAAVAGYVIAERPERLGWALGVPPVAWYILFGSRGDGDGLWLMTPLYLTAWVLGAVLVARGAMVLRGRRSR